MEVYFYTFSKRVNSTAQPTGGTKYDCIIKSPSAVVRPRIALVWSGTGTPAAFNYAYIADFGRYYWITDWTFADRQWIAQMSVDVLATYKTAIGASSKYVLRAVSDYDPDVIETKYPAVGDESVTIISATSADITAVLASGVYVVNVTGDQTVYGAGGIGLYQMTPAQLETFLSNAFNEVDSIITNIGGISSVEDAILWLGDSTIRATTDISQFVNNIIWFPFAFENVSTTPSDVYLGLVKAGAGIPLTLGKRRITLDISLSGYISGSDVWEWLAPYQSYTLEFMPFGSMDLDPIALYKHKNVHCVIDVDALTGSAVLYVYAGTAVNDGPLLGIRTASLGVQIPIAGSSVNIGGAASNIVGGLTKAALSETGLEAAVGIAAGVGNAALSMVPSAHNAGSFGSFAAITDTAYLRCRKLDHVPQDITEQGRPLCQIKTLSTLSGYILCRDGDIDDAAATLEELNQINTYLTGGFFYD